MIRFKNVNYSHGNITIFSHLSFHLARGMYLVISGPARSGKTTIVRMISGLAQPSGGEIIIGGEPFYAADLTAQKLRDVRRRIGGVGGIYTLLEDRTILENIALLCEISGMSRHQVHRSALETCARYRLTHVAHALPGQVSEVERRATLLARAEAARKNIIVADAPTDGLDAESAAFIHERLAAVRLAGATILYLTSGSGPVTGPDEYLYLADGGHGA
jgi:ABC-type ATPase involved in cell division